ncbi:TRAP transporter small permease [Anaerobacillus isosaccharinicus]|uniref:TRAP transporter small permease n=1 Tax=Anaerobacillus isosaccharinicus TaxID=1532552 RepID=A0A1S2LIQ0_9BACI|nr:TRAP transporter small permease [Anaerobacillus isosaccharinicus]MBA5588360.1 TRAP transporter small permease [Anaerobacillus isosaccharinicus]QOY38206.1 TRAP transporter small permease [Anaerobacillus isosaccharinicus]
MRSTKLLDRTLEAATILTFTALIIVVVIQIVSRYLPYSFIWTEELSRFLFLYSIAFSAPLALKDKEFISVDLLLNYLPNRIRQIYEGIVYLLIVIFSAIVTFYGYKFILIGKGQTSATMAIDMSIIHACITVSMVFIGIYALLHVVDYFKGLQKGSEN